MPTRAVEPLLEPVRRTGTIEGFPFWTGRRTSWEFAFRPAVLEPTSIGVRIEASPARANDRADWQEIHEVVLSTTDDVVISGTFSGRNVLSSDLVIRAYVYEVTGTGEYVLEVTGTARWFDPTDDADDLVLLPEHIQRFDDSSDSTGTGRERLVERAEADVITFLTGRAGVMWGVDFESPIILETFKQAIARQTEHLFQIDRLRASRDAGSIQALKTLGQFSPALEATLSPVLHNGTMPVLRHR